MEAKVMKAGEKTARAGFSMTQAEKLTGVGRPTLNNWATTGVAEPSHDFGMGRGKGKRWSFTDLLGLRVIASLRAQGVPLQRVRKLLPKLRAYTSKEKNLSALAMTNLVVLPDNDVAILGRDENPISLLKAPGQTLMQPVMVLDLPTVLKDVEKRMSRAAKTDSQVAETIVLLKAADVWLLEDKAA